MTSFRPYGRAGNFFYMAANCISYALQHGLEFSMPKHTDNPKWNPIYLSHLQHPDYIQGREDIVLTEKMFHYIPNEFKEEWRDKYIIFNGYFQSFLYFQDYRKEILELFNFPYELKKEYVASIHARYSDYLTIKGKHIIIDESYLLSAMELINKETGINKFKVFSDDIPLFKERHGNLYNFEYSTSANEIDDLIEISCCHSNINSSSTFSFWSAWLNQNPDKIVITQKDWFQKGWKEDTREVLTDDIIPENWIKL